VGLFLVAQKLEHWNSHCGNALNRVKACPMNIPLTKAIYEENRETVVHGLFGWLKK
jgi:succinate dehydrogenase / fumarate reductase, iron-sulfur subunit